MNVILSGIVGSTAYGLATESSDIDRLGVYQLPTKEVLSFFDFQPSSVVQTDPDVQYHELGKYLKLALSMNPTVSELLWLEEYEICTTHGRLIVDLRDSFLSSLCRNTYCGYAKQQVDRLDRRQDNTFASDLKKRTQKHGRHCRRLLFQCEHLLTNGKVQVRLTPSQAEECFAVGRFAEENPEQFKEQMYAEIARLDALPTDLPPQPDRESVRDVLLSLRLDSLRSE